MAGSASPPPTPPPEEAPEARHEPRRSRWLIVVTVIAVLGAGAAGYAISEIESTKDENREDDQAVTALRADLELLREQATERLDTVEARVDDAADAAALRRIQTSLRQLQRRVERVAQGDGDDDLAARIDDLEQRVEDLEQAN